MKEEVTISNLENLLAKRENKIAKLERKIAELTQEKADDKITINNLFRKNEKLESQYREIEFQLETHTRSLKTAFSLTAQLCPQSPGHGAGASSPMDIVVEVEDDALEDMPQPVQQETFKPVRKQSGPATTSLTPTTTVNNDKKDQGTQTENPQKWSRPESNAKGKKRTRSFSTKILKKKMITKGISSFLKESVKTTLSKASGDECWGRESRLRDSGFVLVKVLSHIIGTQERYYVAKVTGTRMEAKELFFRVDFLMICRGTDYVFTKNEGEVGYEIYGEDVEVYLPQPQQINGKFEKYCWGKDFDFSKYAMAQN